jgi:hypothetical protein
MTTAAPDDSTVRRSDAIRTRASDTRRTPQETTAEPDWSGSEGLIDNLSQAFGEALGEMRSELEKRIKNLELALAQANGALDVLRGRGVPGTLNIKGTFDARSVYSYLRLEFRVDRAAGSAERRDARPGAFWRPRDHASAAW